MSAITIICHDITIDPYLISQYVINFAHGMQAIDANKLVKYIIGVYVLHGRCNHPCAVLL